MTCGGAERRYAGGTAKSGSRLHRLNGWDDNTSATVQKKTGYNLLVKSINTSNIW